MSGLAHLPGATAQVDEDEAAQVESEASKYLATPDVAMDVDILNWWACNEAEYPNLSVMVRQYLGVLATSASAFQHCWEGL